MFCFILFCKSETIVYITTSMESLYTDAFDPLFVFLLCTIFKECTPDYYGSLACFEVYSNRDTSETTSFCTARCATRVFGSFIILVAVSTG